MQRQSVSKTSKQFNNEELVYFWQLAMEVLKKENQKHLWDLVFSKKYLDLFMWKLLAGSDNFRQFFETSKVLTQCEICRQLKQGRC